MKGQFVRFLLAGGVAASANFGSRFVFSWYMPLETAVVLSFIVGLSVGFVLMRTVVFAENYGRLLPQMAKFIAVNLIALVQTLFITLLLARWLLPSLGVIHHVEAQAHLVGILIPIVTSYFGHRLVTFR